MHTEYLNQFIDALKNCEFYKGSEQLNGYSEGIQAMLDAFTEVKKSGRTAYFVG
ncbi:MAG TPA: phosphoheptose isomerase, partial [Bacteroides sp.]|nr:phosphoheptose isomerase [Bacteroides sp.]